MPLKSFLVTDIVIKPADEGGAIVILNRTDYIAEACRQLNDDQYRKLKNNPTAELQKVIGDVTSPALEQYWITKHEFEYLNKQPAVTPVFYMLPKIHKSLTNPNVRPNESLLEPLSNFMDHYIKPYIQKLPARVRDSTDVINKISELQDLPTYNFLDCL